jgi:hypothetical protein
MNNVKRDLVKEYLEADLKFLNEMIRLNANQIKQIVHADMILLPFIIIVVLFCGVLAINCFTEGRVVLGYIELLLVLTNVVNGVWTTKRLVRNIRWYKQYKQKYGCILESTDI